MVTQLEPLSLGRGKKALICRNVLAGDLFGSKRRNMRSNQGKLGGGVEMRRVVEAGQANEE